MKKGLNVPTFLIVLCFFFAWPVGVVLAILKAINSNYEKEQKMMQARMMNMRSWQNGTQGMNYSTPNNSSGVNQNTMGANVNGNVNNIPGVNANGTPTVRTTNYRTPGNTGESVNGTTYHYSYVKKDSQPSASAAPTTVQVPQGSWRIPMINSNFKRSASSILSMIFLIISLVFSVALFSNAATSVASVGLWSAFGDIIDAVVASGISAALYLFHQFSKSRDHRILTYISVLRGERYYSITRLAEIADVSTGRVIKDLVFMQSKRILPPDALIDRGLGYLLISKDARAEAEAESSVSGSAAKNTVPQKPKTAEQVAEEMSEHEKILLRIRELNDDIDDPNVSQKIDEIETLTRKIFKLVEEKPEMEARLGPFLSYYLPTTLKLLNSYAFFEEQGVRGENITAGMKNIEETLDMLIDGYKTQLDKLFEADTLDVTTDINVLEQMMKADGFVRDGDFGSAAATATMTMPMSENDTEGM